MDRQRSAKAQSDIILNDKNGVDISDRLRFEQMISDLSARFINVSPERLDDEIEAALVECAGFFPGGPLRIASHHAPARTRWINNPCCCSEHAEPVPVGTELPRSINPWAYDRLT